MLARIDDGALDAGPRTPAGRERLCVVTRTTRPLSELIRFVAAPDGGVAPDLKRRLPGRGAWVTARRATLEEAVRRGALQRALRGRATIPADLPEIVDRLLQRRVLDALAIARKAGQVAAGHARVAAALADGSAAALIHAREAGEDGRRRIAAAARRRPDAAGGATLPVLDHFASAELDLAFDRANVIHAALLSGHASEGVLARWRALEAFRGGGERTAKTREPQTPGQDGND